MSFLKPEGKETQVDVAIVGSGPAGITAGIYAARYMLSCIVIGDVPGGQVSKASVIENYPGFSSITATELIDRLVSHLSAYKVPIVLDEVVKAENSSGRFLLTTKGGRRISALSVILATGAKDRELRVPGEREFLGRGVSYCSTCDAAFFRGSENVVVVGGGDTAFESAYLLSKYAKRVTLVHRRSEFRAQPLLVERVKKLENVTFILNAVVTEIYGDSKVRGVKVRRLDTAEEINIPADGVFVNIGYEPRNELAKMLGVKLNSEGYIEVSPYMETSVPGVFAAGDVASMWSSFKQIVTSTAMGAVAAYSAYRYLMTVKKSSA